MPYIVPQQPDYRGEFMRGLTKDLLLAALTKGASLATSGLGRVATAGQYTSPTGKTAMISPAERVASNPAMSAGQMISQNAPAGSTFTPTRYGIGRVPDYEQLLNQIKVQNAPLERQKLQGDIDWQKQLPDIYKSIYGGQGMGGAGGMSDEVKRYLARRALAGDSEADAMLTGFGF